MRYVSDGRENTRTFIYTRHLLIGANGQYFRVDFLLIKMSRCLVLLHFKSCRLRKTALCYFHSEEYVSHFAHKDALFVHFIFKVSIIVECKSTICYYSPIRVRTHPKVNTKVVEFSINNIVIFLSSNVVESYKIAELS